MSKIDQIGNEMFDYIDMYVYKYLETLGGIEITRSQIKGMFTDMLKLKFDKMLNGEL